MSVLFGPPPKVIWVRLGNCSTDHVSRLRRDRRESLRSSCDIPRLVFSLWREGCAHELAAGTGRVARARAAGARMGGADKVKRQHDGGKLTMRERIGGLVDDGQVSRDRRDRGQRRIRCRRQTEGIVAVELRLRPGKIDGRPVVVVGDDFTVRGGSADATIHEKPVMAEQMATSSACRSSASSKARAAAARSRRSRQPAAPICRAGSAAQAYYYTTANLAGAGRGARPGVGRGIGRGAVRLVPLFGDDQERRRCSSPGRRW